jgi:rifampicin phosphotransferase
MTRLILPFLTSFLLIPWVMPGAVAANPPPSIAVAGDGGGVLESLPAPETLRRWIADMKEAPRGPFLRLRWFCRDGSVLPPQPYACRDLGGGVQHGEWSDQIRLLRSHGYLVANILADLNPAIFRTGADWLGELKQMLLEQFLIEADDGWIFHRARFYPGALQVENENDAGRALLLELLAAPAMRKENFLVLREAVRLLPHGHRGAPLTEMRQLARSIEDRDPGFGPLRIKLHIRPERGDAERVRAHAAARGRSELAEEYRNLAATIEDVFQPPDLGGELTQAATRTRDAGLARRFSQAAGALAEEPDPLRRLTTVAELLETLRRDLAQAGNSARMLDWLELSLDLEHAAYQLGNLELERLAGSDRQARLAWLQSSCRVIYGLGLISGRELDTLTEGFRRLATEPLTADTYKSELDALARVSEWAEDTLYFHFSPAIDRLVALDPLFERYIPDRLRGSPLVCLISVLDSLNRDAGKLVGLRHQILGVRVNSGLRMLNPGLARGPLRVYRPHARWEREAIYLLPETLADLPPVAGILTEGSGNSLSHVQLLARNLGIPNVSVAHGLAEKLRTREGQMVVLAASPAGVVELSPDGPEWDAVFQRELISAEVLIRPDLDRLDLTVREFIPLQQLRRTDSGRLVGPKAANLGELKNLYPDLVTEGLAIPFGLFRSYLEQPLEPGGPSVFTWIKEQYATIRRIDEPRARASAAAIFLQRLRDWISSADPGAHFREELRAAMTRVFGSEESYGVFVRSDTNVEDLPGFTGAGLNLTVPNVVGFEKVLQAILQVWASPFTDRAYGWRQAHMEQPEQLYVSVLLMQSVPAEKSGVMVTTDVANGDRAWLTLAVNEGVGGAVDGQRAEELRVERRSGRVRLIAQAAEPLKRVLRPEGGAIKVPASGADELLSPAEIAILVDMAETLPGRFPRLVDAAGATTPADIEFGFAGGHFALFQIRPFLDSSRARHSRYLQRLDAPLASGPPLAIDLKEIPREDDP